MIDVIFYRGSEIVMVRVNSNNITFYQNGSMSSIDGLKLSYVGVIKEFPDLKDNDSWKSEAIARFKEKIRSLKKEDDKKNYIVADLKKFGYQPKYIRKQGFRTEVIK